MVEVISSVGHVRDRRGPSLALRRCVWQGKTEKAGKWLSGPCGGRREKGAAMGVA